MWLIWTFCGQIWPTASQVQLQQGWGMRHSILNFSWGWTRRTWRLIARTRGWSTSQWFPGSFGWCPSHPRQSLPGFPCHSWHLLSDKSIGATCKNRKNIWKKIISIIWQWFCLASTYDIYIGELITSIIVSMLAKYFVHQSIHSSSSSSLSVPGAFSGTVSTAM